MTFLHVTGYLPTAVSCSYFIFLHDKLSGPGSIKYLTVMSLVPGPSLHLIVAAINISESQPGPGDN